MQQASESKTEKEEIVREGEGGGGQESCGREVWGVTEEEEGRELDHAIQSIFFLFCIFCVCHLQRETAHYCNSTETDNNIKPSISKHCFEVKYAIIKTLPRQHEAEKPLSETGLSDLSFSVCVCVCLCLSFSLCL